MRTFLCSYILFISVIFICGCKAEEKRVVRINNVMCRAKPDIGAEIKHVFSKGTILRTKPTKIEFTFMKIHDFWHEVPELNCFTFGGLLEPVSLDMKSERWRIQVTRHEIRDGSIISQDYRKEIYHSESSCKAVLDNEEMAYQRAVAAVDRRNGNCGEYPCGCHSCATKTCVPAP